MHTVGRPIRLSSTAMVVAAILTTLAIWADYCGRATASSTLEVRNERILPENYIYIWCSDGLNREKARRIAPKKVVHIQVATDGGGWKDRKQLPYICTGTYTKFYGMGSTPYYIYDSGSKGAGDISTSRVMANETSFYRWNLEGRVWDIIPPSPWLS